MSSRSFRSSPTNQFGWFCLCGALSVALLVGCRGEQGRPRVAVRGEVTAGGAPLADGSIEFAPLAADGVSSGARIVEGRYDIPASLGLPPGEYLVRIYSSTSDPAPPTPEQAAMPHVQRPGVETIPARYNSRTELRVEVVGRRAQPFDFHLE